MYKKCSSCKEEKLFSEFNKNKNRADGYHIQCKLCRKHYRKANQHRISKYGKNYYESNKDAITERTQSYYETNKNKIADRHKIYQEINKVVLNVYYKNYREVYKDKRAALQSKRRAIKLNASPNWLTRQDLEQIAELYEIAKAFKLYTGQEYHVDHIVPLQGENVCGLHVPWNLQVIPAKENLSKSNKLLDN